MIFDLLFLSIGLIIYLKKKDWVLLYWLFLLVFCLSPCAILTNTTTADELNALNYKLAVISRNYFAILILIELAKGKKFPHLFPIYKVLIIFSIYLFIWSIITHFSLHAIWSAISELLSILLLLIYIVLNKNELPSSNDIISFFKLIIIVETFVIILNLFDIYIFPSHYQSLIIEDLMGNLVEVNASKITGTFYRYNGLANFLTTIFLFISIEYFSKNYIKPLQYFILSVLFCIPIILTGAKISLVIFFLTFVLCGLFYLKKHTILTTAIVLTFFISFIFLKNINTASLNIDNAGIERQISGLSQFLNNTKSDESSTLGLSNYLLNNYLERSPLIGNGYSYKGDYAYGSIGNVVSLQNFKSDARIAYILVEYGLFGFILYAYFFIKIFSYLQKNTVKQYRKNLIICFIYYSILTITEAGFFDRLCFPIIFLYFIYYQQQINTKNELTLI